MGPTRKLACVQLQAVSKTGQASGPAVASGWTSGACHRRAQTAAATAGLCFCQALSTGGAEARDHDWVLCDGV